jgi:hypothetical protein
VDVAVVAVVVGWSVSATQGQDAVVPDTCVVRLVGLGGEEAGDFVERKYIADIVTAVVVILPA